MNIAENWAFNIRNGNGCVPPVGINDSWQEVVIFYSFHKLSEHFWVCFGF